MYEGMFSVIGLGFDADASTKPAEGNQGVDGENHETQGTDAIGHVKRNGLRRF